MNSWNRNSESVFTKKNKLKDKYMPDFREHGAAVVAYSESSKNFSMELEEQVDSRPQFSKVG